MSNPWGGKRVLVTGGAGMIGSHLTELLLAAGAEVTVLDDCSRGSRRNIPEGAEFHWGRLGDYRYYPEIKTQSFIGADVIFHLAARVTGIEYNRTHQLEMMQANLLINADVAYLIAAVKPERYIYVSTACVYPHDAPLPTPEDWGEICNPEPTNYGYGVAKWVGEQQAKFIHREVGIPTAIVRFFNAAGPRDYYDWETSHVIPALIRRFLEGHDPVVVWGTGLQRRVFVDCRDLAEGLLLIAEKGCDGQPTNIGHAHDIAIGDLVYLIRKRIARGRYGWQPQVEFDASKPDGYPARAADTTRLKRLTSGWLPKIPLVDTLDDMIADYKSRYPDGFVD